MTSKPGSTVHYYYVPHHRQKEFEALGWVYDTDLGPPHAAYASLFVWHGEGEPKVPEEPHIVDVRDIDPDIYPGCAE